MKNYLVALLTFFIVFFTTVAQAITLEDIQQQFSKNKIMRADFIQYRYINGLPNPLHSTGKMIISQDLGLWWQQQTPFVITLKINSKRMEQSIEDQKPQIITAESQPQLFQFNNLLTSLFIADKEMLETNFDIELSEQNKHWILTLTPKVTPLNKIFKQIILIGATHLEKITINDMQHDKTTLEFLNHQTTKLAQHEQSLFK